MGISSRVLAVFESIGHIGQSRRNQVDRGRVHVIKEQRAHARQVHGQAARNFAMPRGVSLATLPRASVELATFVTRERDCRSSTRRVIRLAESPVALARSLIRSSRLGASDKCMSVV